MIITLTSARGGTGVTTTAVGLAAVWPRPVLLVEADPCGYIRGAGRPAGRRRSRRAPASSTRRWPPAPGASTEALPGMLVDLPGTQARMLPGLASVAQRKSAHPRGVAGPRRRAAVVGRRPTAPTCSSTPAR